MKLYNKEAGELVMVESVEPRGSVLVIKGTIFGAMPLEAELRPEEARRAFKLLNFKTMIFLLTLPFRRAAEQN